MIYFLDDFRLDVQIPSATEFIPGGDQCLSSVYKDPTRNCKWYDTGFHVQSFTDILSFREFSPQFSPS